jgi:hypothetical protein
VAIFRFEAKVISRGGGRSTVASSAYRTGYCATSAAAYRAGAQLVDERTGLTYDYTKKRGVLGAEIMLPEGAPDWMQNRQLFWNAVEAVEKRKDSQLARDFILSLPHELTQEQRMELTREFVREQFCARGYVADIAWHAPDRAGGLNYHAHVMTPMRRVEDGGFARKKDRVPVGADPNVIQHPSVAWKEELGRLREAWAATANRHLEAAGYEGNLTHLSLKEQGIDREPEPKQGPLATEMEREGRESFAGADRRAVQDRNAARAQMKVEHAQAAGAELVIQLEMQQRPGRSDMSIAAPNAETSQERADAQWRQLREMQAQDLRLQEFRRQAEHQAEEARRQREQNERAEASRQSEGDIASASARYSIALGDNYDVRDPYGSLTRAAMSEYAAFHRGQERMRIEIAKEKDPEKRRLIELKKDIEGHDYMAITSERLAGMSEVIAGRQNSPQAIIDRAIAEQHQNAAKEKREERSRLIQEQEKRREADAAANIGKPDQKPEIDAKPREDGAPRQFAQGQEKGQGVPEPVNANPPGQTPQSNPERPKEEERPSNQPGRKEGDVELSPEQQAKLDKMRAARAANIPDAQARENDERRQRTEEQEKGRGQAAPGQTPESDTKRAAENEEALSSKATGRKDGGGELSDEKQAKLDKMRATRAAYNADAQARENDKGRGGGGRGGR